MPSRIFAVSKAGQKAARRLFPDHVFAKDIDGQPVIKTFLLHARKLREMGYEVIEIGKDD